MSGSWWRVTPPDHPAFLVLVLDDRVVVYTFDCGLFGVGDRWTVVRKQLTAAGFESFMAAT